MDDLVRAEVERVVTAAGFMASHRWARYWFAEACKIAEAVDEPAARWEILTAALKQVGWDTADRPAEDLPGGSE